MSRRVLLFGPEGDDLADALRRHGCEVARAGDPSEADALVTLPPPVELRQLADLGPERWLATFRSWAEEPFFAAQQFLRAAYARGTGGCWVAVTSSLGTQPFPGGGAVGASAIVLQTLVRIAAVEGGPRGVRANAVAPGWREGGLPPELDHELARADTPGQRLADTADLAGAVAFLLSPAAGHITGEVLRVDGGYTITRGSRPDPRRE